MEAACAAAVENTWTPLLEKSVQAILGPPPDRAAWLTYTFEPAVRSPVLLFSYPGALPRGVTYIAREVKIEFGSLTDQRPKGRHPIRALVGTLAPEAFTDFSTEVVALELARTFWEKATILHAEFHRPGEQPMRDRYSRHYADFAALWRHDLAHSARSHRPHARRALLARVAADQVPFRPGRQEPRACKRRPKAYQLLTRPRHRMRVAASRRPR